MEELLRLGIKLIGGLWKDFQEAAEAKNEVALKAFVDKLERDRAELTGQVRAQFDEDSGPESGGG